MNDWDKKDWLDKASEPSTGGFKTFLGFVAVLAVVLGIGAVVLRVLGL